MTDYRDHLEPESHHAPSAGELRRILRQIVTAQHETNHRLNRQEHLMADINTALTDLTTAVDTAVADLGGGVQSLKDALAQAQSDLANLQVQDDADKEALAQSLANAQGFVDGVEAQVSKLNTATGTTPTPDQPPAAS